MSACQALTAMDGLPCTRTAAWIVGVGSRRTDEQRSCHLHLIPTFRAMLAAEGRPGVVLSVRQAGTV